MTIINFRNAIATVGLLTVMALVPTTASARSSIHVDIPGFSIGFHDGHRWGSRHGWRHKRRHLKRHYRRNHRYDYGHRNYGHRNYGHRNYGYRNYGYRYHDRGYRGYGYAPRSRYYGRGICPTAGYSPYSYRGGNCYAHKDHFHCDD